MLPADLIVSVENLLFSHTADKVKIENASPVSGGSINHSFLLHTSSGRFFLKYNCAASFPQMFEREAQALAVMSGTHTIPVPQVIGTGEGGAFTFILLEYLEKTPPAPKFWQQFATDLAAMHRNTQQYYGLDHDNYMGSLKQVNTPMGNWPDFFIHNRLRPQVALAQENGLLPATVQADFERLYTRLPDLLPEEPPSLIHGDLWSGNFISGPGGKAYIFDPAMYYGHREAEVAMTTLFGGFSPEFYDAYNQAWPLQPGWRQRLDIYNLYPLLIHLNLFGSGYLGSIRSILKGV